MVHIFWLVIACLMIGYYCTSVYKVMFDLSKGTCAFLSSNQLALYSELFQNHELMEFCEMQCQFTCF